LSVVSRPSLVGFIRRLGLSWLTGFVFRRVRNPNLAIIGRRTLRIDSLFDDVVNQVVGRDLVAAFRDDGLSRELDGAGKQVVAQFAGLGVRRFLAARPLEFEGRRASSDRGERQLVTGELQVGRVAFDVAVFDVNDDAARELPDTVLEIAVASPSFLCLDTDRSLGHA